jgi:MYXO-CTERM domain-containing protein
MRDTDFRRFFQATALAAAIAIAPSVAVAQAATDPAPVQNATDYNDDDTDLGWLGLLGLAGLLGLRRRDTHVHHTDTTTRRP